MFKRSFILILTYFVLILFLPIFLVLQNPAYTPAIDQTYSFVYLFLVVLALILYRKHLKNEWLRYKATVDSWPRVLLGFLIAFILVLILRVITVAGLSFFIDMDSLGANQQALNEMSQNIPVITTIFMTVVFAPIVEELVYREAIIGIIPRNRKGWLVAATIFSIVFFTFMHSVIFADFLLYLPLTLVLTYYYWIYDRNIIPAMIFHFINNLIAVIGMLFLL